jgi:hypothetical protein
MKHPKQHDHHFDKGDDAMKRRSFFGAVAAAGIGGKKVASDVLSGMTEGMVPPSMPYGLAQSAGMQAIGGSYIEALQVQAAKMGALKAIGVPSLFKDFIREWGGGPTVNLEDINCLVSISDSAKKRMIRERQTEQQLPQLARWAKPPASAPASARSIRGADMTILSPELVEKAARAINAVQIFSRQNKLAEPPCTEICRYGIGGEPEIVVLKTLPWAEVSGLRDIISECRARAAISAVLPDIVEACAKISPELIREIATEIAAYNPDYETPEQSAERIVEVFRAHLSSINQEGK